jgi:hypothetical protein
MPRVAPLCVYVLVAACLPSAARQTGELQTPEPPTRVFESVEAALDCAATAAMESGFMLDMSHRGPWFTATREIPEVTITSTRTSRTERFIVAAEPIEGSEAWRVRVSSLKGYMGGALHARQHVIDNCITPPGERS